jgi:hypothetical protein
MLKISVVMLVTAAFAGLLIYDPYELSPDSVARPINVPPRLANGTSAPAQAETVAAPEAPPTITPQDVEGIVLKVLAERVAPQERDPPGAGTALPNKSVAILAPGPLAASNGSQQRPAPQSAAQTPVVQPVSGRHDDPSVSGMDGALPVKPVAAFAPRPLLASNGSQQQPVLQSAVQIPVPQPVLGKREDPPVSRVDVAVMAGPACAAGEVIGLDPNGDNFLSVRSGPGGSPYRELDRLFSADAVHVCGRQGPWLAVVYSAARKAQGSCDIALKGMQRPYEGPCQYGWVHSRYIKPKATDSLARR